MKLTIDRSRWHRGNYGYTSSLVTKEGKMCCLGFYGCALGGDPKLERTPTEAVWEDVRDDTAYNNGLLKASYPEKGQAIWPEWLFQTDEETGKPMLHLLANINDMVGDDKEREAKLITSFAEHGVEVEFIDG